MSETAHERLLVMNLRVKIFCFRWGERGSV